MSAESSRPLLSLDKTARLTARFLNTTPSELAAAFRPATMSDLPQIIDMRQQVLGEGEIEWDDSLYLPWRYRLGRPGQGAGECWVVMLHGHLLGMVGTESMRLRAGEDRVDALRVMDLLVRPDMEGKGLGAWMLLMLREHAPCVLAVGSNVNSRKLVMRVFPQLPNRRTFVHPIRLDHFLHQQLKWAPAGWLAARLANLAIALARGWVYMGTQRGITVERLTSLPAQLDELLLAAQNPDRIDVDRSRAHWMWRLSTPRTGFEIWVARRRGELLGLMITRRDDIGDGRHAWTVMDAVIDEAMKVPALKALLHGVLAEASRQGMAYLSWVSYRRDIEAKLVKLGFVERANEYFVMAMACSHEGIRVRAEAGADWSFSELHSDGA